MARKPRREEHEEHEAGMERWLLTYADMITLLLALFVVLFSLSTISVKKFQELASSLRNTFEGHTTVEHGGIGLLQNNALVSHPGVTFGKVSVQSNTSPGTPPETNTETPTTAPNSPGNATQQGSSGNTPPAQSLTSIAQQLEKAFGAQNSQGNVSISLQTRGLVVQILTDKAFFATDVATLGPEGQQIVDIIAGVISKDSNGVMVEGYTDNEPIYGGPYRDNWELSAERAVNVVERLNYTDGIDENRLSAVGYGETRPIASNATPAGQQMNRRIDVVILNPGQQAQ